MNRAHPDFGLYFQRVQQALIRSKHNLQISLHRLDRYLHLSSRKGPIYFRNFLRLINEEDLSFAIDYLTEMIQRERMINQSVFMNHLRNFIQAFNENDYLKELYLEYI